MKHYSKEAYHTAVNELVDLIVIRYESRIVATYAGGSYAREILSQDVAILICISLQKPQIRSRKSYRRKWL